MYPFSLYYLRKSTLSCLRSTAPLNLSSASEEIGARQPLLLLHPGYVSPCSEAIQSSTLQKKCCRENDVYDCLSMLGKSTSDKIPCNCVSEWKLMALSTLPTTESINLWPLFSCVNARTLSINLQSQSHTVVNFERHSSKTTESTNTSFYCSTNSFHLMVTL